MLVGGMPYSFLKAVEKWDWFLKPTSVYTSAIFRPPCFIKSYATSSRFRISHFSGVRSLTFLKSRLKVARLRPV